LEKTEETEDKEQPAEEEPKSLQATEAAEGEMEAGKEVAEEDNVAEEEIEGDVLADEETEEEEIEEEPLPRRKEEEIEFVEERIYTIPLRRARAKPPNKRAPKAIRIIRAFVQRHMKVGEVAVEEGEEAEGGRIIISNEVNEKIWARGIQKPPRRLRIRAAKDEEGNVTVFPA